MDLGSGSFATDRPGLLLPLYPMTVADVLDGAFRTWRAVFVPATLVVILVTGPMDLLTNLLLSLRAPDLVAPTAPLAEPAFMDLGTAGLLLLMGLVGVVATVYAAAAIVTLVRDVDRGRQPAVGAALRAALRPAGVSLVALLLFALMAGAAFVGVVILALIPFLGLLAIVLAGPVAVGAGTAFAALIVPIAVLERRGPIATMGRSLWVLRVRFWRTVGITLLLLLVLFGVSLGLSVVLQLAAAATGPMAWAVVSLGSLLVSTVQVPVLSSAALLVYLDARMLEEGYDLEVRLTQLSMAS